MLQVGLATLTPEFPVISAHKGRYDEPKRAIAVTHASYIENMDAHVEAEHDELIHKIEEDNANNQAEATRMDCLLNLLQDVHGHATSDGSTALRRQL